MTTWHIEWRDSKGWHTMTYDSKNAVCNHVEHCLNNGYEVRSIHTVFGKAERTRCIFTNNRVKALINNIEKEQILAVLKENEWVTLSMICDKVESEYRSESIKRKAISMRLYQLRDKGIIEPIPDSRPTRWRLKTKY